MTDASDGGPGDGTPTRAAAWGTSGAGSYDVRVLLVIGNSAVIRTRVMPGVVGRYRKLLARRLCELGGEGRTGGGNRWCVRAAEGAALGGSRWIYCTKEWWTPPAELSNGPR